MYITINNVKAEKRIDLSYSIHSGKEITVIRMLSEQDNVQYQIWKVRAVMDPISDTEKMIRRGSRLLHDYCIVNYNRGVWATPFPRR